MLLMLFTFFYFIFQFMFYVLFSFIMKGNSKISFLQQNSFFFVLFNLFFIQIQCFWISTPFDLISYKKSLLQPKTKLIYTFIPTSYWSAAHIWIKTIKAKISEIQIWHFSGLLLVYCLKSLKVLLFGMKNSI